MLKRICKKKIIISLIILGIITILYTIPSKNSDANITKKITYVNYELKNSEIYLLDKNNYLTRVKISTNNDGKNLVNEIINILACNETSKIPNNLKCILNKNTKINNISIKDNTIKIDLSDDILNVDKSLEEKSIESLVYSLTSIENIDNIILYINGKILDKLPKNNIILPSTLNRNFGINKKYNITSTNNISKTTIYYINKTEDNTFYTPITLVNNDNRESISRNLKLHLL